MLELLVKEAHNIGEQRNGDADQDACHYRKIKLEVSSINCDVARKPTEGNVTADEHPYQSNDDKYDPYIDDEFWKLIHVQIVLLSTLAATFAILWGIIFSKLATRPGYT